MALEARSPAVALEARSPAVALEARSPAVAMATTPLSQAQTARLLAAECYRHKRYYMVLCDHFRILSQLQEAEARLCSRSPLGIWELYRFENGRFLELQRLIWETIDRRYTIELQMLDLGGEKCGALSQASLSVLGTITIGERICITQAVEPQDFKDGAVLIKEGEPRDALFIVVEGQVSFTQRRHHRYEVGPARAALLERLSALALGTPAPRCSARQGSRCSAREAQSATKAPWRLAALSAAIRATPAPISRVYTTGPVQTSPSPWSRVTPC